MLIDSQTPVSVCPFDGEDKVKGGMDTAAEREKKQAHTENDSFDSSE